MTNPARHIDLDGPWWVALHKFWFGVLGRERWFVRNAAVDAALRKHFLGLYEAVAITPVSAEQLEPRAAVTAVVALDQVPRNVFRGTARAFATDAAARRLALDALDRGYGEELTEDEKIFLYLPLEHSENISDQDRCVALTAALGDAEYTRFALAHRNVIAQFGRFPHRNAVLGRASTPEELSFLKLPGSSF